jgi:hypothetical protein
VVFNRLQPTVLKKQSSPPPLQAVVPVPTPALPAPPKKAPPVRKQSTSVSAARHSGAEPQPVGRPKRETHPPAPKDLPYANAPKRPRKARPAQDRMAAEQLKYCSKILSDLHKKQYFQIASPFYEPVGQSSFSIYRLLCLSQPQSDWQKLDIPTYPKVIKKPMDLATMRRKLDALDYQSASEFYKDFKLMIRNCFTFNPTGTPVNQAGQDLQRIFDEKWKTLPAEPMSEDDDDDNNDDNNSDDQRARAIAMMESQIASIRGTISQLKGKPSKDKKKKVKHEKASVASSSKTPLNPPKPGTSKKKGKQTVSDDDALTFEQKKELSEAIGKLDGAKLEQVIKIIYDGVPEIRNVRFFLHRNLTMLSHIFDLFRAPKRLSLKLMSCQLQSSLGCTTLLYGL